METTQDGAEHPTPTLCVADDRLPTMYLDTKRQSCWGANDSCCESCLQCATDTVQVGTAPAPSKSCTFDTQPRHLRRHEAKRDWQSRRVVRWGLSALVGGSHDPARHIPWWSYKLPPRKLPGHRFNNPLECRWLLLPDGYCRVYRNTVDLTARQLHRLISATPHRPQSRVFVRFLNFRFVTFSYNTTVEK
ncbi:uncharacterized protein M421DRAFT_158302 [Didymella exigua CBS 183.55]|uniref:Uncharacterized protein n=1 Tax=Didymella exigua CBS 183.55 TaxID=1150837 RepID=A0A6A5RIV9_9PLEO|nr:uncharacterized protein M421DRAFT_158302 [Didymella exigua CBS 183.55]KAF1928311.1 hypothetical protein M421DRAFT_158302 [Didymella exigua CBS 183.55]